MVESTSSDDGIRTKLDKLNFGWWLLGLAFFLIVAWIGAQYLAWIVFGLFVYYVARPISRYIEGRTGRTSVAAASTLALLVVPIVAILGAILLVALGQVNNLLSSNTLAPLVNLLPVSVTQLPSSPNDVVNTASSLYQEPSVRNAIGSLGAVVSGTASTLFSLFLSLLFGFFLLVSDRSLVAWFKANVIGEENLTTEYLRAVDRGLTSVFFGYTLTIFAVIILSALIYTGFNLVAPGALSIPNVVLFAVITGVFTLIPLVGRSVVYLAIVALLALEALQTSPTLLWFPVVFFLVMVGAFDNLVRTYIRPYLSGKVFPLALIMFAYILGPSLFGWYGIFLGPLLLAFIFPFIQFVLPSLVGREGAAEPETAPESESIEPPTGEKGFGAAGGDDQDDAQPL